MAAHPQPEGMTVPVRIWDLPTRLFHWSLVVLIVILFASSEFELLDMRWHIWSGYAVLVLLIFRILWGFIGSQTSRFGEFVRGPAAIIAYVRSLFSTNAKSIVGHNPLGGWSVLALLACVLVQTVTGLFSSDEVEFDGPFVEHVSVRTAKLMTRLHHWNESVLIVLIGVHVVAVLLYLVVKRENLITPMISGVRRIETAPELRFASAWRALALLLLSVAAVALMVWSAS